MQSQPHTKALLAPTLSMGPVLLNVHNLEALKTFYRDIIGLDIMSETPEMVTLGHRNSPIVILHEKKDLPLPEPTESGLYHLAILFSTQSELAKAVMRIVNGAPELFAGSADHLVSEAFYLTDPEGNGVELYFDRDAATWEWTGEMVQMDSLYLPSHEYIQKHGLDTDVEPEIRMGHIHLKVGDLKEAEQFYVNVVGFTITSKMPSALFVSVNGYHHHLGMNTWESIGAGQRSDTLGLSGFEIILDSVDALNALKHRLDAAHITMTEEDGALHFSDPWKNRMIVRLNEESH